MNLKNSNSAMSNWFQISLFINLAHFPFIKLLIEMLILLERILVLLFFSFFYPFYKIKIWKSRLFIIGIKGKTEWFFQCFKLELSIEIIFFKINGSNSGFFYKIWFIRRYPDFICVLNSIHEWILKVKISVSYMLMMN